MIFRILILDSESRVKGYHLGELICLVSTFPVNLYFINPPAPEAGEEEGAAKSEEGIRIVLEGVGAGMTSEFMFVGCRLRILGMVADKGIDARDLKGGRGVAVSFSFSTSFLVCFGADTRRVISFTGRAGRIIGDYDQLSTRRGGDERNLHDWHQRRTSASSHERSLSPFQP